MLARAHIIVSGLVHGVYYRAFTEKKANSYGITGWVRNLPAPSRYDTVGVGNDRVEVVCEGEKGLIIDFIKELRVGPPSSDVSDVIVEWQEYTGEFKTFKIIF